MLPCSGSRQQAFYPVLQLTNWDEDLTLAISQPGE